MTSKNRGLNPLDPLDTSMHFHNKCDSISRISKNHMDLNDYAVLEECLTYGCGSYQTEIYISNSTEGVCI